MAVCITHTYTTVDIVYTLKLMHVHYNHMTSHEPSDLVERTPDINGAVLDDSVHGLGDGSGEVWVGKLRVEEYLWTQEPLVAHVH